MQVKQELGRIFDLIQETKNIDPSYNQNLNTVLNLQMRLADAESTSDFQNIYNEAKLLEDNILGSQQLPNYIAPNSSPPKLNLRIPEGMTYFQFREWDAKQGELVDAFKQRVKKYLRMFLYEYGPNLETAKIGNRLSKMEYLEDDPGLLEDFLVYIIHHSIDMYKKWFLPNIFKEAPFLLSPDEFQKLEQDINQKIMYFENIRIPTDEEYNNLVINDQVVPLPKESDIEKLNEFRNYLQELEKNFIERSKEKFRTQYLPELIPEYNNLRQVFPKDTQNNDFKFYANRLLNQDDLTMSLFEKRKIDYDIEKSKLRAGSKKKGSKKTLKKRSSKKKSKRISK